jgi:hypothetical protein
MGLLVSSHIHQEQQKLKNGGQLDDNLFARWCIAAITI